ncbi:MAG: hypothetical protein ACXVA2_13300 [Mucilaginibacter sp.]
MKFLLITFITFLCYSPYCYSQLDSARSKTDKEVLNKIKELYSKKVDTIICYYSDRGNWLTPVFTDSCVAQDVRYLCWHDNNQSYIQRFDECKEFDPTMIGPSLFKLLRQNYSKIVKEQIKVPEYITIIKGKKVFTRMIVVDVSYKILELHLVGKTISKEFTDYALQTKYFSGKHLNRNYAANQHSSLNKLRILIEKEIKHYYRSL